MFGKLYAIERTLPPLLLPSDFPQPISLALLSDFCNIAQAIPPWVPKHPPVNAIQSVPECVNRPQPQRADQTTGMATHIACPSCFTLFRLDRLRPGRRVQCGHCRERFEPTPELGWSAKPVDRGRRWAWIAAVVVAVAVALVFWFWRDLAGWINRRS